MEVYEIDKIKLYWYQTHRKSIDREELLQQ